MASKSIRTKGNNTDTHPQAMIEDPAPVTLEPKDVFEKLKAQLTEYLRQSEQYKQMAIKTQGALEIVVQMYPEVVENES